MRSPEEWRAAFEARGLVYDAHATRALRKAVGPERTYDLRINTIVMRNATTTEPARPYDEHDASFDLYGATYDAAQIYYKYASDGATADSKDAPLSMYDSAHTFCDGGVVEPSGAASAPARWNVSPRSLLVRGQEQALWPELHLALRRLVAGRLECGRGDVGAREWSAIAKPLRKYDCDPAKCRQTSVV